MFRPGVVRLHNAAEQRELSGRLPRGYLQFHFRNYYYSFPRHHCLPFVHVDWHPPVPAYQKIVRQEQSLKRSQIGAEIIKFIEIGSKIGSIRCNNIKKVNQNLSRTTT